MEDHVGAIFRPAPYTTLSHLCATEVDGANLALACAVIAREPLQAARGFHGSLQHARAAIVEHERLPESIKAVLVAVQLVILCACETIGEHLLRIHRLHGFEQRGLELIGISPHERKSRPPVKEVAVIGEAAA